MSAVGNTRQSLGSAGVESEQKAIKEVMVFLQGVGVSTSLAVRIYKKYQDDVIRVVRREPYQLAADVRGIGFKTADAIAQAVGIAHDSPEGIKAGLQYTLLRCGCQPYRGARAAKCAGSAHRMLSRSCAGPAR